MYSDAGRRAFLKCLAISTLLFRRIRAADDQKTRDQKPKDSDDAVYEPGGEVKPPKLVHYVEPSFSPNSKEAFVEGTVKISTVINHDGVVTNPRVTSGLNTEEDKNAIEAVKQWKFQPGAKNGHPVNVRITIEVDFHLL